MHFQKECKRCGKMFQPHTRASECCDNCRFLNRGYYGKLKLNKKMSGKNEIYY